MNLIKCSADCDYSIASLKIVIYILFANIRCAIEVNSDCVYSPPQSSLTTGNADATHSSSLGVTMQILSEQKKKKTNRTQKTMKECFIIERINIARRPFKVKRGRFYLMPLS